MIKHSLAKKVLAIGPDFENHRGGIGAVIELHKNEFETFHFIPTYKYYNSNFKKVLFFIGQFFRILIFLKRNPQIQIIHMHTSQAGSFFRKLLILLAVRLFYKKKIINHTNASHFHDFYNNSHKVIKNIIKFYLRKCDLTITVSEFWKEFYTDTLGLKNVVRLNNLSKQVTNVKLFDKKSQYPIKLLFLGRIGNRKGIFDLIDVIIKSKTELDGKIQLLIGGDGEIDKLKSIINESHISEMVQYKGWVSGSDKIKLINESDIFILPSYNEGMPLSILEVMGYGKPVISTNISGVNEIVRSYKNGILTEPGDKEALLLSLFHYINNIDDIKKHGAASLEIIKDYYPEKVIPQLEVIYKKLLPESSFSTLVAI